MLSLQYFEPQLATHPHALLIMVTGNGVKIHFWDNCTQQVALLQNGEAHLIGEAFFGDSIVFHTSNAIGAHRKIMWLRRQGRRANSHPNAESLHRLHIATEKIRACYALDVMHKSARGFGLHLDKTVSYTVFWLLSRRMPSDT